MCSRRARCLDSWYVCALLHDTLLNTLPKVCASAAQDFTPLEHPRGVYRPVPCLANAALLFLISPQSSPLAPSLRTAVRAYVMELLTNFVIIHARLSAIAKPLVPRVLSTILAHVVREFAAAMGDLKDVPQNRLLQVPCVPSATSACLTLHSCSSRSMPCATRWLHMIECQARGTRPFPSSSRACRLYPSPSH
jgi:hypothetical protein